VDDGPLLLFDANGDGHADVLQTKNGTNYSAGATEYQPRLWLNDGRGKLVAAGAEALSSLPICVGAAAAADFNRDGHLDVLLGGRVVPGSYPRRARSALLLTRGGRFEDATEVMLPVSGRLGLVTSALVTDV